MIRGFSLVEIVVATSIVGVTLVALGALVHAVPLARTTHDKDIALAIASDEIGALRASGYEALPGSGPFTHSLLAALPEGAGALAVSDYNDKTKQLAVTVSWQDPAGASQSVTLATLVAQTGGLP